VEEKETKFGMFSLLPEFSKEISRNCAHEIIFVVDRSGSMRGSPIRSGNKKKKLIKKLFFLLLIHF
jgi:hypothetical protein